MRRPLGAGMLGLCLAAACHGQQLSAAAPDRRMDRAVGCYVITHLQQTAGPEVEFLFPSFFELNAARAPAAAVPGRQVWLPSDDLSRRAGSWSWSEDGDTLAVQSTAGSQGWRLRLHETPSVWAGHLQAWAGDTLVTWDLDGRRVACPQGLVPAAM